MKRLPLIFLTILSLLTLGACTPDASSFGFGQATPIPADTPTPLPTPIKVFQTAISADGEVVLSLPPQILSFQSSGLNATIEEVYVVPGQTVKKGDPLVKVDDTDLRTALEKAEAALASTEAQIANEQAPALAGDIAEAQVSLEAVQAELAHLLSLPSEDAINKAAADLKLNEVELAKAQAAYDTIAYADAIGASPQAAELQKATLNYERALAVYNEASKPATEAEIAAARSKIVQAQNRLDKLLSGLRPEAQAINEAKLHEAQLQVEEARTNLTKALLLAPWDGLVTEVNGAPGISTSNASITLAKVEPLRFVTSNFSERNLSDIKIGDEATIYLKSYPNVPFPAIIQRIELASTEKDGDTALFKVYLDFNSGKFMVRPGMTGRLEISIEPQS
jgi:multidrug resistance efflux pump